MTAPGAWRRNLFAVTAATFIGFTGFTLVMPFLPLYFRELGVTDLGEIALWSGLSLGITPAITALLAPWWGRLADRFGRKIMVERSLASFVVVMAATAYVTEAWQVFALRLFQGFFAGYGVLALAMAADSAPPGRLASAIGTVQVAQRLGPALGPVIGGVIAGIVGLRRAFLVAAGFYAVGFLLVLFAYRERPLSGGSARTDAPRPAAPRLTLRAILRVDNIALLMAVIFGLQFADRSFGPILPLYLGETGVPEARVPVLSGLLFAVAAGAGALGNVACAQLVKRLPSRIVLAGCAALAAAAAAVLALEPRLAWIFVATGAFGLAVGTAMTAAYTAAGRVIPAAVRGTGFGILSSASLAGLAVSPIVCGALGALSIRLVFVADALLLAAIGLGVLRAMPAPLDTPGQARPQETVTLPSE
jgi:MFS family permease